MSANAPQTQQTNKPIDSYDTAAQEKFRQFCYEWALMARRIIGRDVEDDELNLLEALDIREPEKPTNTQEK